MDGIETVPADLIRGAPYDHSSVRTRVDPANESQWARDRVRDVVRIYGLTEAAEEWMNSDIHIGWIPSEPGYAGARWGSPTVGHSYSGALLHEVMHVFWHFWDGFPEPCDRMNLYTFRRDMAQFAMDIRDWYHSDFSEPFPFGTESWRVYYNMMVFLLEQGDTDDEDFWEVLERGEYIRLWESLYHSMECNIPVHAAGNLSLVPPTVQKYFQGFIKPGEDTTWDQQIYWYSILSEEDRELSDPYIHYFVSPYYTAEYPPNAGQGTTRFPEPLRTHLREADRQLVVDFMNSLEEIRPWEWTDWFLYRHSRWHIYRTHVYRAELGPELGIELEEENFQAVLAAMDALYQLHCSTKETRNCRFDAGSISRTSPDDVREIIGGLEALTDKQRRVLLEFVVLERGEFN